MEYRVNINGIDVLADYTEENIRDIFVPLLKKFEKMHKEKGSRFLVMVAAPPGAGKSTLVSFLESLAADVYKGDVVLQAVGMDGFHRRQEYLLTHNTVVDGKEIPMVRIKGAPVTFDLDLFKAMILKLLSEKELGWPSYDRHLHNPVDNAVKIYGDIILLEGNYLLLDEEGWSDISELSDYTIFVRADEEMLRERLTDRKEASGNTREKAKEFVDFSDMRNVRLCLERSKTADLELVVTESGEYIIGKNRRI